jgi:hypothetical protein
MSLACSATSARSRSSALIDASVVLYSSDMT